MRLTRRRIVLAAVGLAFLAVVLGFGPLVRSQVREAAGRRGAEVDVAWVKPAWGAVVLEGVDIRHPDAPDVRVHLDRVRVSLGSPRHVEILGGTIELTGSPDALAAQLERLRGNLSGGAPSAGGGGPRPTMDVGGLSLRYREGSTSVTADGVAVRRTDAGFSAEAERVEVSTVAGDAKLAGALVDLVKVDGEYRVARVHTEALEARAGVLATAAAEVQSSASEPASDRTAGMKRARALLETVRRRADETLTSDGRVELEGVRATLPVGGSSVALGPARIVLARKDGRLELEYQAGKLPAGDLMTAEDFLVVRATLPTADEALAVTVKGGPISFGALGVREGDLHLVEVEQAALRTDARVEIDPAFEVVTFDGQASISGVSFRAEAIAKEVVRGVRLSFRGKVRAALDKSRVSVQNGELELGNARLEASLDLTREPGKLPADPPRYKLDASYEVPLVACQALLDAAPDGLLPTVQGMKMAGSLALKGKAKFDTKNLDRDYAVGWDLTSTCRVTDVPPSVDVARFRKPWKRVVRPAVGEDTVEIETGPGTAGWASLSQISRFAEVGVVSFEDARFRHHEGFDSEAIRNSIRENLRTLRFTRGASTISMQLAKNLYLYRDKRLARKIEEAILTTYLEQALTKDQIIELYLNVVEFGPMVYGVDAAAQHYFHTSASRLTVSQAFYLASVLPSPKVEHFATGGAVSAGWLKNLRTVMKYAHKRNRLTDEDLGAGLGEIPVRGSPVPLRDPNAEAVPAGDGGGSDLVIDDAADTP